MLCYCALQLRIANLIVVAAWRLGLVFGQQIFSILALALMIFKKVLPKKINFLPKVLQNRRFSALASRSSGFGAAICVAVVCTRCKSLLCVKASVCKSFPVWSISVKRGEKSWEELVRVEKSWQEVTRVEMSWERGEIGWAEVRRGGKSWEEVARGEKSWDELRRVEKSWEEVGRGESRWEELRKAGKKWKELRGWKRWKTLRAVEKSCENWDELRWSEKSSEVVVTAEKGWGKMRTNSQNRVEKVWGFTPVPIGKPCLWIL